jgi:hypothetical protein
MAAVTGGRRRIWQNSPVRAIPAPEHPMQSVPMPPVPNAPIPGPDAPTGGTGSDG